MLENVIVGDLIKAYDFEPIEGREELYVIGAIDRIEEFAYVIKGETIIKDTVFETARMAEGVEIRVPFKTRFEYDGRITALTEHHKFTENYYAEIA
jgi:hypothetical protein